MKARQKQSAWLNVIMIMLAMCIAIGPVWAEEGDTSETGDADADADSAELAQKLANPIWSYHGSDTRDEISNSFVQPFCSYTSPTAFGLTLQTETSYNWKSEQWSVPINLIASPMTMVGKLPVQFAAGVRYWAESPDAGPEGWGFRAAGVLIFPR